MVIVMEEYFDFDEYGTYEQEDDLFIMNQREADDYLHEEDVGHYDGLDSESNEDYVDWYQTGNAARWVVFSAG